MNLIALTVSDEALVTWALGLCGTVAFGIAGWFFKSVANELKLLREDILKLRDSFSSMVTKQALLERDATSDRERITRLESHVLDGYPGGRRVGDRPPAGGYPTPAPSPTS